MPYIRKEARDDYDSVLRPLADWLEGVPEGDLNYVLTRLIQAWLGGRHTYSDYNAALGVLEAVKQEFYRRVVAPYEDKKIKENGDVY